MPYKSCFSFLLLVFAVLFFGARVVNACSCVPTPPTVLEEYEDANVVVIVRAVSVEKAETDERRVDGVRTTRMIVERVFKGDLKAGDEMTFGQGGGADCVWTFGERSVGRQYLFYLDSREKTSDIWYAGTCGRSKGLVNATDNLLFLNNLDKLRGKTRISGRVGFVGGGDLSVGGRVIRITGAKRVHEVKTDERGVYEIYDLPAGRYTLEAETPPGWKVGDDFPKSYTSNFDGRGEDKSPKKFLIVLEEKKHVSFDVSFEIDNALRGKIYDAEGKLMKGVCLNLMPAQGTRASGFSYKAGCTKEDGTFEIKEIPAGGYVIVVNSIGRISSVAPFKTFYYPDVSERERATIIHIGAGETLENFQIRVPKVEETITVEGVLRYSDGKPVAGERVEFKAANSNAEIDGDARARTDATGRFSIKVLKCVEGELSGEMFAHAGEFENCPKLEALIKEWGNRVGEIKTDVVKIQAGRDLKDVELRFTFPACKKAKKTMREEGVQQER